MISITFKYRVVTFPYKMRISESTYKKFESIIHPKLKANIHKFKKDGYYFFPSYHGCRKRNRNGTNKKVNYRIGEMCEEATYNLNWKSWDEINWNSLPHKFYLTRFMTNLGLNALAKNKGNKWYNWNKKEYIDKSEYFKPQFEEIVSQIHKPKGQLIKNEVVL